MHYDTLERSFKDSRRSAAARSVSVALVFTPRMKKRLTRRTAAMINRSLSYFPELSGKTITVGYTRKHLGSATVVSRGGVITRLVIRLRARRVTYQTIGHELTHLIQGLANETRPPGQSRVPSGEKQCDIWTLARHEIFCDDAPTYLRLPRWLRESWSRYARTVRALCIAAVEKRRTQRRYIHWLEAELRSVAKLPIEPSRTTEQLELPFAR